MIPTPWEQPMPLDGLLKLPPRKRKPSQRSRITKDLHRLWMAGSKLRGQSQSNKAQILGYLRTDPAISGESKQALAEVIETVYEQLED